MHGFVGPLTPLVMLEVEEVDEGGMVAGGRGGNQMLYWTDVNKECRWTGLHLLTVFEVVGIFASLKVQRTGKRIYPLCRRGRRRAL